MSFVSLGIYLLLAAVAGTLAWYWLTSTFHGKLFYYRVFKLRLIAGNTSRSEDGWTKAENTLCGDFKKFIPAMDRKEFENAKAYLKKSGDLGRKPLPFWLTALIGLLIIAEGLGFSYMLGTFIAPEGSSDTANLLMVTIVLVLCIVLGIMTHASGSQLYRTSLIRAAESKWKDTTTGTGSLFKTHEIGLDDRQSDDDGAPPTTQLVNRVGDTGKYYMVFITGLTIALIAWYSTDMRMQAYEKTRAGQTVGQSSAEPTNPFAKAGGDGLPEAVTAPNDQAHQTAAKEIHDAGAAEAMSAFIMLALIFVITQIVAIYSGFKWGFGGKEGDAAYRRTRGLASWEEVCEVKDAFIEPVEALMTALHARFGQKAVKFQVHSFRQYLAKTRVPAVSENTSAPAPTVNLPPLATAPAQPAQVSASAAAAAGGPDFEMLGHVDALDRLQAKEDKENYILGLKDSALRGRVIQALRERQERLAAARELEGLF